jgi:hypothetical protein
VRGDFLNCFQAFGLRARASHAQRDTQNVAVHQIANIFFDYMTRIMFILRVHLRCGVQFHFM